MSNQLSSETATYLKKFGEESLMEISRQLSDDKSYWFTDEEAKKRMKKDIDITYLLLTIADNFALREDQGEREVQENQEQDPDSQEYVVGLIVDWLKTNPMAALPELQVFAHHIFDGSDTSIEYLRSQTTLALRPVVWDWILVQNIDTELHRLYPKLVGSGGHMGTQSHGFPQNGNVLAHFLEKEARNVGVYTFTPVDW